MVKGATKLPGKWDAEVRQPWGIKDYDPASEKLPWEGARVVTENGDSQTADRTLGEKGVKSGGMETWSSLEWLVAWMELGTLGA